MANEIAHSTLEADVREADRISGAVELLLADRAWLRGIPCVDYKGSVNGAGSDTMRISLAGLDGYDAMAAASSEFSVESNVALTDSSYTIAVTRRAIVREVSDLAGLTARPGAGDIDVDRMAASIAGEYESLWSSALCTAAAAFTNTVGTTTVDLTADDIFDAIYQLQSQSVEGPFCAVLHPTQINDLIASLRAEGGALAFSPATADMLAIKGPGYAGSFLGVEFWRSSKVPTANTAADRAGFMAGAGALAWASGTPRPVPGAVMSMPSQFVTTELQRVVGGASTKVVGHAYFGLSIAQDSKGVAIITDA